MKVFVWAPNANGGGGKTSLRHLLVALCQDSRVEEVCALVPREVGEIPGVGLLHPRGRTGSLRDHLSVAQMRSSGWVVLSPLNFGPLLGSDVLYQRNALYFDLGGIQWTTRERLGFRLRRTVALKQMKSTKTVVVPSHYMRDLVTSSGVSPESVIVVPHGVPRPGCLDRRESRSRREEPLWRGANCKLLWIGVPTKQKNLQLLGRALVEFSRRNPGLRLRLLITASRDQNWETLSLASLLHSAELDNFVDFIGALPHERVLDLLETSDCLLMPSSVESFCLPVVEALAAGTPCAVAPSPSLSEFGQFGATVALGATDTDLASAIEIAIGSGRVGEVARSKVFAVFNWRSHISTVLDSVEARQHDE